MYGLISRITFDVEKEQDLNGCIRWLNTTSICSSSKNDTPHKGRSNDTAFHNCQINIEANNSNRKKKGKGNKDLLRQVYAVVRLKHKRNLEDLKDKVSELSQKYGSLRSVARRLGSDAKYVQNS